MRPGRGDITITRSDRNTASGIEWVISSTVLRAAAQMRSSSQVHLLARHRVERAEGLVHQQERGVVQQAAGDGGALLHAAGQLVRVAFAETVELHQREQATGRARRIAPDGRRWMTAGSRTFCSTVR